MKNPNPKVYILSDYIYIIFSKRQNYSDGEQIRSCQTLKVGGKGVILKRQHEGIYLWWWQLFCILRVEVVIQIYIFDKISQNISQKKKVHIKTDVYRLVTVFYIVPMSNSLFANVLHLCEMLLLREAGWRVPRNSLHNFHNFL